jgi:predicted RNase H-like HicB family nuclease
MPEKRRSRHSFFIPCKEDHCCRTVENQSEITIDFDQLRNRILTIYQIIINRIQGVPILNRLDRIINILEIIDEKVETSNNTIMNNINDYQNMSYLINRFESLSTEKAKLEIQNERLAIENQKLQEIIAEQRDWLDYYENSISNLTDNVGKASDLLNPEKRKESSDSLLSPVFKLLEKIYKEGKSVVENSFNNYNSNIGNQGDINSEQIIGINHNYSPEQRKTLSEAAAEIQQLLEQLSRTYPTNTNPEKITVANEAIHRIENNPILRQKILRALKAGSVQALGQYLNHPIASFFLGALEEWRQNKGN